MRVAALVLAVIAVGLLAWQAREEGYQTCLAEQALPLTAEGTIRPQEENPYLPGNGVRLGGQSGTEFAQATIATAKLTVSEPSSRASCARWP